MKIASILTAKGDFVATVPPMADVAELLRLLAAHGVGALVVSGDGETIEGIVSERDIVRRLAEDGEALLRRRVAEIMTVDVQCAPPSAAVDDVMAVMTSARVRHVPIVEDGRMVGIVSIGDVVKSRLDSLEGERAALVDYITRGG